MTIKHFFNTRKVEVTDGSEMYEIISPDGYRVASAENESKLIDLEMALNLALTDHEEADSDIVINC